MPEGIGPAGAKTAGKNPKVAAEITNPGTILSQTPKYIEVSKVLWERAIDAAKAINISVPLDVRLAGTNFKEGKKILDTSGLKLISAENLDDAAKKIVEAIK